MGVIEWFKGFFGGRPSLDDRLRYSHNLLGLQNGPDRTYVWPPRNEWIKEHVEARRNYEFVMNAVANDIGKQQPYLRPYLSRLRFTPEDFKPNENSRAHTGGWIDEPNNQPYSVLNNPSFRDTYSVQYSIRHEIWHKMEREDPQFYRGPLGTNPEVRKPLREFVAYLRDLEADDNDFKLRDRETAIAIIQSSKNLEKLRREDYMKQNPKKLEDFENRHKVQLAKCDRLRNSPIAYDPELKADLAKACGWKY